MALWGLVQVTCGLFILMSVGGYWGHNIHFNNPILVIAASTSYITAGKCTIAFSYFRGKVLMVAVVISSALSINFGTTQFILLAASHHGRRTTAWSQGYYKEEGSVYLCKGTIETVICLGSILKAFFLAVFLRKCRISAPGFVHLEEETDIPPPPYDTLETGNPPPPYDMIEAGNQDSQEATSPPPIYTIADQTRYQANITLAWQGDC